MNVNISHRRALLLILMITALLLGGCGSSREAAAPEVEKTPEPTTEPTTTPVPVVVLNGREYLSDTKTLDFSNETVPYEDLMSNAAFFASLREIELGKTALSASELVALTEAFPEAEVSWQAEIFGKTYDGDCTDIDLSDMTDDDLPAVCEGLGKLPYLKTVNLIPEDGYTPVGRDALPHLAEAAPEASLRFSYLLYGQEVDTETAELRYSKAKIGDEGIAVFRQLLPFLPELKLLRLADCGITDNDAMAALRSDYPNVNIVWSIELAGSQFMTDTTLVNTPLLRDKHVHLLQYFPDVLYLDLGHNKYITSVDFIKYLPKLQVAIIALTYIKDVSSLANCPDLEFCELFTTPIEDISPLAGLRKLEYLNLGNMPNLKDLTPLYEIKSLKLVRICGASFDNIKEPQIAELREKLPDCTVSTVNGHSAFAGGWRFDESGHYTERYALLRKQMLYDIADWKKRQSNSPSA